MARVSFLSLVSILSLLTPSLPLPGPPSALSDQWSQWKVRHGKTYAGPLHEASARAAWLRHWRLVQSHNSRSDVTFTLELNVFADQEIRQEKSSQRSHPHRYVPEVATGSLQAPPASFDWRTKGVISPVRNQGQLGNSEAFAVTDDLESLHVLRTGRLVDLSVAEVVDCCSADPRRLVPDIYECIAHHGGLCSEADYPAHVAPAQCRNQSCQAVAKDCKTTGRIAKGDEDAMVAAILKRPLVVYVDASRLSFQLYQAGVYSDPQCGHRLDHVLQLVGYGQDNGLLYWILKNSWGSEWGMQGYILMKRGVNMCGVADSAIYPQ